MTIRIAIFAVAAALSTGCTALQQPAPRPFGQAYTEQFHQQIVGEPYAAATPVEGLDGRVARNAVDSMRDPDKDKGPSFAQVLESLMEKK